MRALSAAIFLALVAAGLLARDSISDAQWLSILGTAWLFLLVALWPALPPDVPSFGRATVRTAVILASLFAVVAVQLVRVQIVLGPSTAARVGVDPATGEVIANLRVQIADLTTRRGRIFDRAGVLLADTVFVGNTAHRVYPEPNTADVLGYFSPLLYGKSGLEAAYDAELAGLDGNNAFTRNLDALLGRPPEGLDLHLTLDADLQRTAHQLLAGRPGAIVLIDVQTGAVLVLASNPLPDPNRLFTSSPAERDAAAAYWAELTADRATPLLPRATSGLYPPGSTFKVLSAAAVIDAGIAGPDTVYEDNGALDVAGHVIIEQNRPDPTRDTWTLREGLAWSLNVVFAQVGLQLGPTLLPAYGERFGFGAAIPFDLPVAASRLASTPDFFATSPALADTGFGQGELQVTPLQMVLVAAAIANHGELMRPYLVAEMTTPDGETVWRAEPGVWLRPVSGAAADQVAAMMVATVEEGVAQPALLPGYVAGGKTGTAESGDGPPHAWFIGFVGDPEPRYAVAVVLEHGGSGLATALPIGRDLLAAAMAG